MESSIQLKDPSVFPSPEVLEKILGDSYPAYENLMGIITDPEHGLEPVWNYYKDGHAWLCKICQKKKTVFWLSVWENHFKVAFYFTDRNKSGIADLAIRPAIKETFDQAEYIGKLIPLTITVTQLEQIKDVIAVVDYKRKLK